MLNSAPHKPLSSPSQLISLFLVKKKNAQQLKEQANGNSMRLGFLVCKMRGLG